MTPTSFLLIFMMCSMASLSALAGTNNSTRAIELNRSGTELLKKQKFQEAQDKFAAGLAESPFAPELQFNLGIAFDGAGNVEKAKQSYELAVKYAKDPATRFAANFNLGELAGRGKKIDEALSYYQLALMDKPDSVETKTNIELLIQEKKNQDGKGGESKDNKDSKDDKDKNDKNKDNKNDKDKNKDQNKDKNGDSKDNKDDSGDKDKDKGKNGYDQSKPQPKPFKSDQLSPGDVKKILEELDRQEQRVRAEYNKKQAKERPRDKDW